METWSDLSIFTMKKSSFHETILPIGFASPMTRNGAFTYDLSRLKAFNSIIRNNAGCDTRLKEPDVQARAGKAGNQTDEHAPE